jgi:branched-chain amino acid transport system substrate-binding protein
MGNTQRIMAAAVAALCALGAGCAAGAGRAQEIRLGAISMLSGDTVPGSGRDLGRAARLAAKQANASGGVLVGRTRRTLTIMEEDDRNSPDAAVEAARTLILREHVVALVGPQFSSNAIPVARLAEQERVPMICPMSTHPDTTAGKRFVFRIPYVDTFQGAVLARFARERLGELRAAVLYDVASVYNTSLGEVFARTFTSLGGAVVASETYTTDKNTDFTAQLRRVAAAEPDLLFLPNYAGDVLTQAKEARSLGIRAQLLGGDGWDGSAFAAQPEFDGSFYTTPWHPALETPQSRSFSAAFREAYGEAPTDVAATTYDAVTLLIAAIEKAKRTDAEAIREALVTMAPLPGVTGTISFRGGGDPVKSAVVVQIRGGGTSVYAVMDP